MRSDMRKVIIDCGRHGGRGLSYKRARKGRWREGTKDEDSAKREAVSMRRGTKSFCDRLSPLARYLEKQVGRPWDKVWSEISTKIPADGVMQIHVRGHVWDLVRRDVVLVDRRPFIRGYQGLRPLEEAWSFGRSFILYICPRTGLLRKVARKPRRRLEEARSAKRVGLGDGRFIEQIDEVWFLITPVTREAWDPKVGKTITVYEEKKKTMSKREIRDLVPTDLR